MEEQKKEKTESFRVELDGYRYILEGGTVRVEVAKSGNPFALESATEIQFVGSLVRELCDLSADLEEATKALEYETARSASLLDNWQATQSQAELAKKEQERDKALAAELGRELARMRDAAGARKAMRPKPKGADNENGPELFNPLRGDEVLPAQRSPAEAARMVADAHLPGGVPIVPPKEITPASADIPKQCPHCGSQEHTYSECPSTPF